VGRSWDPRERSACEEGKKVVKYGGKRQVCIFLTAKYLGDTFRKRFLSFGGFVEIR
jgi:hypothetical protein